MRAVRIRVSILVVIVCIMISGLTASAFADDADMELSAIIEAVEASIPDQCYGDMYLDENGTIHVNVTDDCPESLMVSPVDPGQYEIVFEQVQYSISELEAMKDVIVPYMAEYRIAVLDANEVNNSIDVTLYSDSDGIEELLNDLSDSIDVSIVNISTLDEGIRIQAISAS